MKNFYATTSIAYTNAPPHLGYALELIQADVVARYHRILGEKIFFLTGTDEHGAKVTKVAEEERKDPKEFVDKISEEYRKLKEILNLSNDDFIRTTDEIRHWPIVKKFWQKLKENGDIYKKKYQGLYCVGCEAFITKKDLIDGKCKNHQKEPELIEEENYFFRLSKYSKKIEELIEKDEVKIIPEERKNEMLSFIGQGLEDVSFSRPRKDLKWGVPVPDDDSQTIYVWADALVNYISALGGFGNGKFKEFWPPDIHFLGKDILRFHATIWLGMLLSLGLELPKNIFVHGFITSNGQKMSKSLGNVIDPFELVKKYSTDAVRYFLLREIPPTEDGDFTLEKFKERYNSDLANGIGNLLARTLKMAEIYWNGRIPKISKNTAETLSLGSSMNVGFLGNFQEEILKNHKELLHRLENFEFNRSLFLIISNVFICDGYIAQHELYKPSSKLGNDPKKVSIILYNVLEAIRIIAYEFLSFLPETTDKIFEQLGLNPQKEHKRKIKEAAIWGGLKPGTKMKKGESLFPRIC